jgi:hypothetical protein
MWLGHRANSEQEVADSFDEWFSTFFLRRVYQSIQAEHASRVGLIQAPPRSRQCSYAAIPLNIEWLLTRRSHCS